MLSGTTKDDAKLKFDYLHARLHSLTSSLQGFEAL